MQKGIGVKKNHKNFKSSEPINVVRTADVVASIEDRAFQYCRSLTKVNIPEGAPSLKEYMDHFNRHGNLSLPKPTIPPCSVDLSLFDSCSGLTNITTPEVDANIGGAACAAPSESRYSTGGRCLFDVRDVKSKESGKGPAQKSSQTINNAP